MPWIDARRGEIYGPFSNNVRRDPSNLEERANKTGALSRRNSKKIRAPYALHFFGSGALVYKEKILKEFES